VLRLKLDYLFRNPVGENNFLFSKKRSDRLRGPPKPLLSGYRSSFPGSIGQGANLTTQLHLVSSLKISVAKPHLPLYAITAWTVATSRFQQGTNKTLLKSAKDCRIFKKIYALTFKLYFE
jgi:hypothetical protein